MRLTEKGVIKCVNGSIGQVVNDQNVYWIYQKAICLQEEPFQRNSGSESHKTWAEDQGGNEEVQTAFPKQQD